MIEKMIEITSQYLLIVRSTSEDPPFSSVTTFDIINQASEVKILAHKYLNSCFGNL